MKYLNLFVILINLLTIIWFKIGVVKGIVGGREANPYEYKYMVSVQADNKHVCGGAIIADWYVLTAARCVIGENDKFKNRIFSIFAGSIHLQRKDPGGINEYVDSIYVPDEFGQLQKNSKMVTGDIAVLKLRNNLVLGTFLRKINLPVRSKGASYFLKYANLEASIIGFGFENVNQGIKRNHDNQEIIHEEFTKLKTADAIVLHKNSCKIMFSFVVDDKLICAQVNQHRKNVIEGVCNGDEGGPLVINDDTIIGILVQKQPDCNEKLNGSLYTRITSFIPFINKVLSGKTTRDIRIAVYKRRQQELNSDKTVMDLVEINPIL